MFSHFWERQSESGEGEREGDTESEAGFRFWALSTAPNKGLEPTNLKIMTWAELRCSTIWATQAPLDYQFLDWGSIQSFFVVFLPLCLRLTYRWLFKKSYLSYTPKKYLKGVKHIKSSDPLARENSLAQTVTINNCVLGFWLYSLLRWNKNVIWVTCTR